MGSKGRPDLWIEVWKSERGEQHGLFLPLLGGTEQLAEEDVACSRMECGHLVQAEAIPDSLRVTMIAGVRSAKSL